MAGPYLDCHGAATVHADAASSLISRHAQWWVAAELPKNLPLPCSLNRSKIYILFAIRLRRTTCPRHTINPHPNIEHSTTGLPYIPNPRWLPQTSSSQQSLRLRLLCPTISPRQTPCLATKVSNGVMVGHPTTPRPVKSGKKVSIIIHDAAYPWNRRRVASTWYLRVTYHAFDKPCGQRSHGQQGVSSV